MKSCRKGAIVNKEELGRLVQAVNVAIDYTEIDRSSNRVPNKRLQNAADRDLERAWAADLRWLRHMRKNLLRCLRLHQTPAEIKQEDEARKFLGLAVIRP
jgi:hypothetical protein